MSGSAEAFTVISRCPTSGRVQAQEVRASMTAIATGPSTKVVINGFGLIGCTCFGASSAVKTSLSISWPSCGVHDPKTTRNLLRHYAVLGTLKNDAQSDNDAA